MNLMPIPAGWLSSMGSSRRHTTRPTPWIRERSSESLKSNLMSVPAGMGLSVRMKTPPLLTSRECCSINSFTVALLNLTLIPNGTR